MPVIIWHPNPLRTVVQLDEHERIVLRLKLEIERLQDRMGSADLDLDPEWRAKHHADRTAEEAIAAARRTLNCGFSIYGEPHGGKTFAQNLDELLEHYVTELVGTHDGDCTCVPCSCSKCHAEHLVGVNTTEGLGKHPGSRIKSAFWRPKGQPERTLDEAIERLRDYEPVMHDGWPGGTEDFQKHVPRWRAEAKHAHEWLVAYKAAHFPDAASRDAARARMGGGQ